MVQRAPMECPSRNSPSGAAHTGRQFVNNFWTPQGGPLVTCSVEGDGFGQSVRDSEVKADGEQTDSLSSRPDGLLWPEFDQAYLAAH